VKVGDLVMVGTTPIAKMEKPFVSIILEICLPEEHRNAMHLIQVLENGQAKWYPVGYIRVINEGR
tara:strand:+ start:334 stop:528 length:195 start_codon:yes stop_codon:yes gene_type:complete